METKNLANAAVTVAKVTCAGAILSAFAQIGYLGGMMLFNDIEYVAKAIDSKINPVEAYKDHIFGRTKYRNARTKKPINISKK